MCTFAAKTPWWTACGMVVAATIASAIAAPNSPSSRKDAQRLDRLPPISSSSKVIDYSGRKQRGQASYYAASFAHRKMADGNRLNPQARVAASKTLPLGTTARVVNLQTGKAVVVKIEDRGPFAANRVMDVTPKVAEELAMTKRGVTPVEVKPITVPQPNGETKLGAGAAELTPQQIREIGGVTASR